MPALLLLLAALPGLNDLFDPFSKEFPASGGRVKAKQAAFEEHLRRRGPGAMLRAMRRCEKALADARKNRDKVHGRLLKARASYFGWMEDYARKYRRQHKQDPAHYPMPESVNRGFIDAETAIRQANSIVMRELDFHRWALERLAQEAPRADAGERAVFESELRAKAPHQRLRAARLLAGVPGWDPTDAFRKERHPAVAAALAPGAEALGHESGVVRAGGIAALAKRRERASVEALVARWPKEEGRLRDDLHDALARVTGRVEADWPGWWKAQPADWQPGPPPPAPKAQDPGRVVETLAPDDRRCFGLQTGSERFVLCVGTAAGWAQARAEVARFLSTVPESARYSVVAFGEGATAFRKSLVPNGAAQRKALAKWMEDIAPGRRNDLWTGMDLAFDLAEDGGADTLIVFNPTRVTEVGESPALVGRPRQIGFELSYRNALLRIRVLGFGRSGGGDAWFLQELAREYGGGFIPLPSDR